MKYYQDEVLEMIQNGKEAYEIINEIDPKFIKQFKSLDKKISKLLIEIQKVFPDACYYTASGKFNLLIGRPHSDNGNQQQDLVCYCGDSIIDDGDF